MIANRQKHVHFDHPCTYRIQVQGKIDPSWSDRLEGMTISYTPDWLNSPVTTLEGEIADQAALLGILNTLYELRLSILSVISLTV